MSEEFDWEIPLSAQPKPEQVSFDLDRALGAVVGLRATIPEDAFTAGILGTERTGNGILIGANGLVLTIGYLIAEAESVWLTASDGSVLAGHALGYDFESGFGLGAGARPLQRGPARDRKLGRARGRRLRDHGGDGGRRHSLNARVFAKREFAGYWEYVLDEAVFTAPPHPNWGRERGSSIATAGSSASVRCWWRHADGDGADTLDGNMIVPIDLLPPILDDMQTLGRTQRPPRPWLGAYVTEVEEALVVAGLAPEGPAEQANCRSAIRCSRSTASRSAASSSSSAASGRWARRASPCRSP